MAGFRSRTPTRILLAAAAGAVAAFFLDPARGHSRRAMARQRLGATARRLGRGAYRRVRRTGGATGGAMKRLAHLRPAPPVDDIALLDRVRSEIFARGDVPKGDLNLEVVEGVVTVQGQVPDEALVEVVEHAIQGVAGVTGVRNLLHLPGTPAPNKEAALRA
jgi:osmotically-inducible protein OsmY